MYITLIGILAAIFITAAGLPQLFKIFKTKKTKDLSLITIVLIIIGISLWLVYGIIKEDVSIIMANCLALIIQGTTLGLKLRYK
jgi:MtN3 and saliva related transmembrane protein